MQSSRGRSLAVWGVLAALFSIATIAYAFETAMHFRGSAIDGPFQLYNALRRIQGGFHAGVDFQYFHGLGIPFSHYWLYRLLGDGLRGSELARELITALSYSVVYLVVFRAFTKDWVQTLCLTGAAIAASYFLRMSPVIFAVNGMLGLRSAVPTMLAAALYLIADHRRRALVAGLVLGGALFMSTEQGLAALLAYLVVSAIIIGRPGDRRARAIEAAAAAAIAIATLVVLLMMVAGVSGMRGAFRYNFRLVPMDQYWYFGAPPNVFIPTWGDAFTMVLTSPAIAIALIGSLFAAVIYLRGAWKATDDDAGRRNFALAYLGAYGLISCASLLGVFTPAYVQPSRRILLILVLIEATRYAARIDASRGRAAWLGVPRSVAVSTGVIALYSVIAVPLVRVALVNTTPHIVADHLIGDAQFSMDGIWPATLAEAQRAIDAHRKPDGTPPTLWSTYAGWIEARNNIFHPATDYTIHALGTENRAAYIRMFREMQPTLVQTVLPTYSQYEPWMENNQWPMYEELLRSYRVYSKTPWSIFWERRATPAAPPTVVTEIRVPAGAQSVQFTPSPSPRLAELYDVEIEYTTRNPLGKLPLVGATPRYLIGIRGALSRVAISLDPNAPSKRFPLLARGGVPVLLSFATFGLLPGASWQPSVVRVRHYDLDAESEPWMSDLRDRVAGVPVAP